jgi:Ni,Fe-hydrogenase III large subunit/Ni,Fe-hydrogenase III component G
MITTPITPPEPAEILSLEATLAARFKTALNVSRANHEEMLVHLERAHALNAVCKFLFWEAGCSFSGIIVEEREKEWQLTYLFLLPSKHWIHVCVTIPLETPAVPSVSATVHAADWYEREIEDLFGLHFEEHPRLGDFVLHDQVWQEGLAPMRRTFDLRQPRLERQPTHDWRPMLVVRDPGAFAMPVGPVYEGGLGESVHFLLETVGEDVIRASPRLFYKYRAVEKLAEGKTVTDAELLAERFSAKSAFAHSLAYCQAVERAAAVDVPPRANGLRVALAELERLRHHAGAIEAICQSTALNVSEAQAAIVEEQLLRASCSFSGHRYLFGLNTPGGLRRDFSSDDCRNLLSIVDTADQELRRIEDRLRYTSSFLDRLEDMGSINTQAARDLDLLGPVGRASGLANDLRVALPYAGYTDYTFEVAHEKEGDGYARLRVLFFEARESVALIHQALESLRPGDVRITVEHLPAGSTMGWAEAPIGAAVHWLRINDAGLIDRYRIMTASFRNWLGLHAAVENFAFQDFPIILATFGLSVAECDR